MELPDLTILSADELYDLRVASTRESDRRDTLATMPWHITTLAQRYTTAGGDIADLHAAIDAA